jgi:hypothetical protein
MIATNNDAKVLLGALHGSKPDKLHILLWEKLDRKLSYWFTDWNDAAEFATNHRVNLYAGVNLSGKDYGMHRRCESSQIAAQCAFIADIDVFGPAHKSELLPPTFDDARLILPPKMQPTILIDSGHGLQAWWLLKEPVVFGSGEARAHSQFLAIQWHRAMERRAAEKGWKLDAVHDLARVLRVPGTINRKDGVPDAEARILEITDTRYDLCDIEEYVSANAPHSEIKPTRPVQPLLESAAPARSDPPQAPAKAEREDPYYLIGMAYEKMALGDGRNETGFWLACQFRDNGFSQAEAAKYGAEFVARVAGAKAEPYTPEEYKASLRSAYSRSAREPLVRSGAQILVAEEAELLPVTATTIASVGGDADDDQEDEDEDDVDDDDGDPLPDASGAMVSGDQAKPPQTINGSEEEKRVSQALVFRLLGLNLEKIEKHGSVKGHYRLYLADGRQVEIGDAKVLDTQSQFRVAVIDGLNQQIPRLARQRWDRAVTAMLKLVQVIETLTPAEMLAEELQAYIYDRGFFCDSINGFRDDPEDMGSFFYEAKRRGAPIVETGPGGRVILSLRSFVAWVHQNSKTSLTALEFANLLSRFGFKKISTIASTTFNGKREKLNRVWGADLASLPIEVTDEHEHRLGRETVVAIRKKAAAGG